MILTVTKVKKLIFILFTKFNLSNFLLYITFLLNILLHFKINHQIFQIIKTNFISYNLIKINLFIHFVTTET